MTPGNMSFDFIQRIRKVHKKLSTFYKRKPATRQPFIESEGAATLPFRTADSDPNLADLARKVLFTTHLVEMWVWEIVEVAIKATLTRVSATRHR